MSDFTIFRDKVNANFEAMKNDKLFEVDLGRDELSELYLDSFAPEDNKLFRERREHDCNCCLSFIRNIGSIVSVDNKGNYKTIWDVKDVGVFQPSADALAARVRGAKIKNIYTHFQKSVGNKKTRDMNEAELVEWDHLYVNLPSILVVTDPGTMMSSTRANKDVLLRSLTELTLDSAETVLELIAQNSLYKGAEFKAIVTKFVTLKKQFDKVTQKRVDSWIWLKSLELGDASKIRNTAIGTLLTDLSEGRDLESAVGAFEAMVAPINYKRSSAVVTKSMINNATKKIEELGVMDSLPRRFAVQSDLTINNVLYADNSVKQSMNVMEELGAELNDKLSVGHLNKVEDIGIDDFVKNILPTATKVELLVENSHTPNLMSLVAPVNADAPNILKWDNNFTWSYNGEVTDSIKERVKNAGGDVTGFIRASLAWHNGDDLDIYCIEPNGNRISFHEKTSNTSGRLDVDMNANSASNKVNPVENITWTNKNQILNGDYSVKVNNYAKRYNTDVGFVLEIEVGGKVFKYVNTSGLRTHQTIDVVTFNYTDGEITIVKSSKLCEGSEPSKNICDIDTEKFVTVNMVMNSPNHWDDQEIGNKHVFFILDKCKFEEPVRGFYNEFLRQDLNEHRKVFEVLSGKMVVEPSDDQLSGLGFSSTQRNSAFVRVTGKFNRIVKVNF